MDEFMKRYHEQMDKIVLSESADRAILDDILKAGVSQKVHHTKWTKKGIRAAVAVAAIVIISSFTVFAALRGIVFRPEDAASNPDGEEVNIGASSYYDLLAGSEGEVYALTDEDYTKELTDHRAIVWVTADQGHTWNEALSLPEEMSEECYIVTGVLQDTESGIRAVIVTQEEDENDEYGYSDHLYLITADGYKELDAAEALTHENALMGLSLVNEHTIAMLGMEQCVLYDMDAEAAVKSLPVTTSMGCLTIEDQFLLYGEEIYYCLDAETFEEQEADEGLQEFVRTMYEKNSREVYPPMEAWQDTVVCASKGGIYEYKDGETTQIMKIPASVSDGYAFNGMMPMCRTRENRYYISVFSQTGMSLWRIDAKQ